MTRSNIPARAIQSIARRNESDLRKVLEEYIISENTSDFLTSMKSIHDTMSSKDWWNSRWLIFRVLGIGALHGVDRDLIDILESITPTEGTSVLQAIKDGILKVIRKQLDAGNSFFLNTEQLVSSEFAVLVPEIIHTRFSEIHQLYDKHINTQDLARTYYGFSFLTHSTNGGRTVDDMEDYLESAGIDMSHIQLPNDLDMDLSKINFSNCSPRMNDLLHLILQLFGRNTTKRAIAARALGENGDTRAEPFLRTATKDHYPYVRHQAVVALGKTRIPDSIHTLALSLNDSDDAVAEEALAGLISIGNPAVIELIKMLDKPNGTSSTSANDISLCKKRALRALGRIGGELAEGELNLRAAAEGPMGKSARDALEILRILGCGR